MISQAVKSYVLAWLRIVNNTDVLPLHILYFHTSYYVCIYQMTEQIDILKQDIKKYNEEQV